MSQSAVLVHITSDYGHIDEITPSLAISLSKDFPFYCGVI